MSEQQPQRIRKRKRKHGNPDRRVALRVRQISVLLGGLLLLTAATLWATGVWKPLPEDQWQKQVVDPDTVDPALQALAEAAEASNPTAATEQETAITPQQEQESEQESELEPQAQPLTETGGGEAQPASTEPAQTQSAEETPGEAQTPVRDPALDLDPNLILIDDEGTPLSDDWLEARIQLHIDEVEEVDLADFRRILQYLDQQYIGWLMADGFTREEQDHLRAHLRSQLSAADYERSKDLFVRYSHLMY